MIFISSKISAVWSRKNPRIFVCPALYSACPLGISIGRLLFGVGGWWYFKKVIRHFFCTTYSDETSNYRGWGGPFGSWGGPWNLINTHRSNQMELKFRLFRESDFSIGVYMNIWSTYSFRKERNNMGAVLRYSLVLCDDVCCSSCPAADGSWQWKAVEL